MESWTESQILGQIHQAAARIADLTEQLEQMRAARASGVVEVISYQGGRIRPQDTPTAQPDQPPVPVKQGGNGFLTAGQLDLITRMIHERFTGSWADQIRPFVTKFGYPPGRLPIRQFDQALEWLKSVPKVKTGGQR